MASLEALARRLEAAHIEDPADAALAKELRATLLVLGAGSSGGGRPAPDIVDAIRSSWESGA